ncbi:MAG: CvpA family protein [Candidatus Eisenbacteria bacterium]|nr:CvpA family protein [Candidatus Eisenbacteria bacterium]
MSLIHGLTWLDWALLVLVIAFAIRGVFRGTVWQIFALCAVICGVWVGVWVSRWVGAHWQGARPTVVFVALRWIVSGLAALAVASLISWWGELLSGAVRQSPIAWVDRVGGLFVGASIGVIVAALVLLVALSLPWPRQSKTWAAEAHVSRAVLTGAERACGMGRRVLPGSEWLQHRFEAAAQCVRPAVGPS